MLLTLCRLASLRVMLVSLWKLVLNLSCLFACAGRICPIGRIPPSRLVFNLPCLFLYADYAHGLNPLSRLVFIFSCLVLCADTALELKPLSRLVFTFSCCVSLCRLRSWALLPPLSSSAHGWGVTLSTRGTCTLASSSTPSPTCCLTVRTQSNTDHGWGG